MIPNHTHGQHYDAERQFAHVLQGKIMWHLQRDLQLHFNVCKIVQACNENIL